MPATYEPIATYTIPSAQANYTFSSIPSTYTDLVAVIQGVITASADASFYWRANGDTSALYSATRVSGNGTAAASFRASGDTAALSGFIGNTSQSTQILNFMNYANTTTFKTSVSRGSYSAQNVGAFVSLYRSTSAISSLTFYSPSGNLDTGMTLTLYGIKAA